MLSKKFNFELTWISVVEKHVLLILTTGCRVNPIHAEEPNPHLEYLKDLFWGFVAHATHPTNETAEMMGETQHGQKAR